MKKEKEECTALVKYEPKPLSLVERLQAKADHFRAMADEKRDELSEALEKGLVRDPITGTIVGAWILNAVIGTAIAGAAALGSSPIARATMPKKGKPC